MAIKDKALGWYIQHYLIPRSQVIDKPGFVIFRMSYKTSIYSRQVVMPESLFVSIERNIVNSYGNEGIKSLYSAGKKFGCRFALMTNVLEMKNTATKDFLDYVFVLSKFVEGTYASNISTVVNLEKKMIDFKFNNFVICRISGLGYIISVGGIAGIWSAMIGDSSVEGIQLKCQGKGDNECRVIAAPIKNLKNNNYRLFKETNLKNLEIEEGYKKLNDIRVATHSSSSLKKMIDSGIFTFEQGILKYKEERYFIVEASFPYIIEMEIAKLKNGEKMLFDMSFEYGKKLAKKEVKQDPCKFITDFMTALGWGDILVTHTNAKYVVYMKYFPWTRWFKKTKFVLLRGMLSGMITGFIGRKYILKDFEIKINNDSFNLILS
jgi:hypothetical protein